MARVAALLLLLGLSAPAAGQGNTIAQAHQFMIDNFPGQLKFEGMQSNAWGAKGLAFQVGFDPKDECRIVMRLRDGARQPGLVFTFASLSNETVLGASSGVHEGFETGLSYAGDFRFITGNQGQQVFAAAFRFSTPAMRDRAQRAFQFMIGRCTRPDRGF